MLNHMQQPLEIGLTALSVLGSPSDIDFPLGSAWNIAYPASWEANTAGAHEGNLTMRGPYNGHSYEVVFSYAILEQPVNPLSEQSAAGPTLAEGDSTLPSSSRRNAPIAVLPIAHKWRLVSKTC
jgi:hypothetical protein